MKLFGEVWRAEWGPASGVSNRVVLLHQFQIALSDALSHDIPSVTEISTGPTHLGPSDGEATYPSTEML